MIGRAGADFSFSGLKTAVRQVVKEGGPLGEPGKAALAADFQAAVVDVLVDRVQSAMQSFRTQFGTDASRVFPLVAAGGVAANSAIRTALQQTCDQEGFLLILPPVPLCTDNGAMVAWAGLERLAIGSTDRLDAPPRARWPLET
jgi:N6-L-threonylcarbamoyladenine synthase